jgi:hypothetical protein
LAKLLIAAFTCLAAGVSGFSQVVLFVDDFDGPNLNPEWQSTLPNAGLGSAGPAVTYVGAPNFGFGGLGTNSVLRMTNTLSPLTRRGWSSSTSFSPTSFRYEVRFNTLNQSGSTSIDAFLEIWILDAGNSNRFDKLCPFGGDFSASRRLLVGSSIDDEYYNMAFNYQNNTYYRLVLEAAPGQNIRASVLNDSGVELTGQTLAHGVAAFGSGFKLVIAQAMGSPFTGPSPVDVAVDFAKLTTSGIPPSISSQPQDQFANAGMAVTFNVGAAGSPPLDYQWRFGGTNLPGKTNAALALNNVQATNAGVYSVRVSNAFGFIESSNATLVVNRLPVANPQSLTLDEDASVNVTLTGMDPDGDALTFAVVMPPAHGTLSGTPPNLVYRPTTNYFGTDSLRFRVNDGHINSATATVTISILPINDAPTARSMTVVATGETPEPIVLSGADPEENPLTFTVVSPPAHGTLSGTPPYLLYRPNAGYAGPDSVQFKVNDSLVDSAAAAIDLNIVPARVLLFDDFSGPALDTIWESLLPDAPTGGSAIPVERYVGAPDHGFETLDGYSVLRMTNTLAPTTRRGWSSGSIFTPPDFRYEIRFNTLDQAPGVSIDAFVEIWTLDAGNSNRFDITSPFGGDFSSTRRFFAGSGIDTSFDILPFSFQNHTYYRLVLEAAPGQNVRASVRTDGGAELMGRTFAHDAAAFSSGFKVVLAQAVGLPFTGPSPVDVAVDFAKLTTTRTNAAPEARILVAPLTELLGLEKNVVLSPVCAPALVTLDGSQSTDPDNTELTFEWRDGTNVLSMDAVFTREMATGSHEISLRVSDGQDIGVTNETVTVVTPTEATQLILVFVEGSELARSSARPLIVTLKNAVGAFENCNAIQGLAQLQAFQNKVRAQVAPSHPVLADRLIGAAQSIISGLGDY